LQNLYTFLLWFFETDFFADHLCRLYLLIITTLILNRICFESVVHFCFLETLYLILITFLNQYICISIICLNIFGRAILKFDLLYEWSVGRCGSGNFSSRLRGLELDIILFHSLVIPLRLCNWVTFTSTSTF
jgi:hypothetical protein